MILALVGPSASGKTPVSLQLAEELRAEIVCADSMTVYRGLDIGTAKPTVADRARVPHHLLDLADPGEPFTVARYQRAARRAIEDILGRGRVPFVVGGSGLYFRGAVDELSFPPTDPQVRARLDGEATDALVSRLRATDPASLAFVDTRNKRRVVRALEVIEITGTPFSAFRDEWERHGDAVVAGLDVPREILASRVERRLREMLAGGLLDEVAKLRANGFEDALTSSRAIGYAEALAVLDGKLDEEGFLDRAGRATLKLARRQLSWFRRDPRVQWFDASEPRDVVPQLRAYYVQHLEDR